MLLSEAMLNMFQSKFNGSLCLLFLWAFNMLSCCQETKGVFSVAFANMHNYF